MAASLVVAAMLIGGLGEVTRQFASTMVRVRDALEETRDSRLVAASAEPLERARRGGLVVSASTIEAAIGVEAVRFELSLSGAGRRLSWGVGDAGGPALRRTLTVGPDARFELGPDGAARLWVGADEPPLLVVLPRVTAPQDCAFDVVLRDCR
jgi:hypothetical protein